jgi:hypothetical protein
MPGGDEYLIVMSCDGGLAEGQVRPYLFPPVGYARVCEFSKKGRPVRLLRRRSSGHGFVTGRTSDAVERIITVYGTYLVYSLSIYK